jgi:hypothetical protein
MWYTVNVSVSGILYSSNIAASCFFFSVQSVAIYTCLILLISYRKKLMMCQLLEELRGSRTMLYI